MNPIGNDLLPTEDMITPDEKSSKQGGKKNALAIIATVWNGVVLGITALRALLLPLSFLVSTVIAVIGSALVLLWSLPLSMASIVMPLIPLGIVLVTPMLLLAVIALEWIPVALGAVGLVLSIRSFGKGKEKAKSPMRILGLILGIASVAFTVVAGFWLTLSALIACIPLLVLGVVCLVFLVQMIAIAIGNSAV